MIHFLLPTLAALALATAAAPAPSGDSVSGDPRPDVVVILADDLGQGDLGAYNPGSLVPTPRLDALAAEGLRFTDAHSPSAVCTPTRYGVLTGRYCWRTRVRSGVLWGRSGNLIDPERVTLPDLARAAGYRTLGAGKWHLGLGSDPTDYDAPLVPGPLQHGFDRYFGIPASLDIPPYLYFEGDRAVPPPSVPVAGSEHRRQGGGGFWRAGLASPGFVHEETLGRIVDRSLEYLEQSVAEDPERPLFLYLALSAPHTPWLPSEPFRGVSGAGHYGDFVAQVDHEVGRVLDALERLDRRERALVVVTSDNGSHWPDADVARWGHDANNGLRGQKADAWEGGHRVPFLVRWPGRVPAGEASAALVSLTDLAATFAGLQGVSLPPGVAEDGVDQTAALLSGAALAAADAPRTEMVQHSIDGTFVLRQGPWKYIDGLGSHGFTGPGVIAPEEGGPTGQLYRLDTDPFETRNLWLDEPARVARMAARLAELRGGD